MKSLRLAVLLLLLCPGTALAAGTSLSSHELKPGVNKPAHRFDLVGLHWKGDGAVTFRTRSVKGRWSPWHEAAPEEDRPDARNHELRARGWNLGSPYWTGASNRIQVRTYGHVTTGPRLLRLEPGPEVTASPHVDRGVAADPDPRELGRRRADPPPPQAGLRGLGAVRRRPSHGRLELVHAGPVGLDRPRHRALPRARQRLGRHRLQLPRRQVRPDLRGPLGRGRQERRRSARAGLQQRARRASR